MPEQPANNDITQWCAVWPACHSKGLGALVLAQSACRLPVRSQLLRYWTNWSMHHGTSVLHHACTTLS